MDQSRLILVVVANWVDLDLLFMSLPLGLLLRELYLKSFLGPIV
jgi:hypothetical protein